MDETTADDTDQRDWAVEEVQCQACARRERRARMIAEQDTATPGSWLLRTFRRNRG